jgi:hypothetical protein
VIARCLGEVAPAVEKISRIATDINLPYRSIGKVDAPVQLGNVTFPRHLVNLLPRQIQKFAVHMAVQTRSPSLLGISLALLTCDKALGPLSRTG